MLPAARFAPTGGTEGSGGAAQRPRRLFLTFGGAPAPGRPAGRGTGFRMENTGKKQKKEERKTGKEKKGIDFPCKKRYNPDGGVQLR